MPMNAVAKKNEHHTTDEETKQWHMPMNDVANYYVTFQKKEHVRQPAVGGVGAKGP